MYTFFSLRISSRTAWLSESGPTWKNTNSKIKKKVQRVFELKLLVFHLKHFSRPQWSGDGRGVGQLRSNVIETHLIAWLS